EGAPFLAAPRRAGAVTRVSTSSLSSASFSTVSSILLSWWFPQVRQRVREFRRCFAVHQTNRPKTKSPSRLGWAILTHGESGGGYGMYLTVAQPLPGMANW